MRQWLVETRFMCDRHLMGEHVEHHMIVGAMKRRKSLDGYFRKGLIFPSTLVERHNEIASEMLRRGFKHKSDLVLPFDDSVLSYYVERERELRPVEPGFDPMSALPMPKRPWEELMSRCTTCMALYVGKAGVRV